MGDTALELSCGSCGHANRAGARFCAACGAGLAQRCAACGEELSDGARFCDACGAPAGATAGPEAALKVVSVVFGDLSGSTAMQEALEPEAARSVMVRFHDAMRAVIEQHDGRLEKLMGDGVVAVFGTPAVREDDALRAVRCAAAMVAELEALNAQLEPASGVRLAMRTGVNTGELVVSGEGELVGDTMNTAARFEQAAEAGQTLLGEATWRLVRDDVQAEPVAPLELKGKAAPVRAWRLVSAAAPRAVRGEAPLVGRGDELERLRGALAAATEARTCRLVTVIGSPGLGKTRLAHELARAVASEATLVEGHCEPTGEGITFLPVADVLRGAAGIDEADPPEAVREKLAALVAGDAEATRVAMHASAVLGVAEPASAEETFWAVRRVLEALARRRPLVVVLDDIHWGQPMFLDLVEHLVEWVRDAPILLVALARPELRESREALASAGRRAHDVIELTPLGAGESRALVEGQLGALDLPGELLDRILDTTEGNPLFLGELVRMLVDEGAIRRDGDAWVVAGGADSVQVPPTIQALLSARIERLRSDERSVVERAAVIGRQFYRGAVAELVAPPVRAGIDGHLETLRRKELVEPEGTYWIDEPVYRFHHVLIRDAAYRSLLKEARAELHERFADWLQGKAGDLVGEHEEVIAYHLEQAHEYRSQLGPLDDHGRALGARAAQLLASAGRRALAREDLAAAANLLRRALDRGATDDAEVLWDLAEAALSAGDTSTAGEAVERLAAAAGEDARVRARAQVLAGQLSILTGSGQLEEIAARVGAATDVLASLGDGAAEAKGHHVQAQAQAQLGQVAAVEAALDHGLLAARGAGDSRRITAVLAAAPRAALWGPSPVVRASGRCLDVVRILRMTPGNRHVEAVALRCQAVLEAMRGRPDAAREILDAGRATLEELGLALELGELAMHAGIVELLAADAGAAEAQLRRAHDGFVAIGVDAGAAQAAALLARALVEQGRDEEAIEQTRFAEQHAGGDLKTTITWLGVRAEALARRGEHTEALELARRAMALAEPTDALADKADASMALARVLAAAGEEAAAAEAAATARGLYDAKDHAIGAARAAELARGHAASGAPRPASARAEIPDPDLARFVARYADCYAARDVERIVEFYSPDYVLTDHRTIAWEAIRGLEGARRQARSTIEASLDLRFEVDEVLACSPGVLALRATWRGTSSETGGAVELPMGHVSTVRDGQFVTIDVYEPEDRDAILARFAELAGGEEPVLGDRPPERVWVALARCYAARDVEAIVDLYADDWRFVDHRRMAWDEMAGRDQARALNVSAMAVSPDLRVEFDEVLACDERVIAFTCAWRGAGEGGVGTIEVPMGFVAVVEAGRIAVQDAYEPDDRVAMTARYAELGGGMALLGDRPPELVWREVGLAFAAHDFDRLRRVYAEDIRVVDHRSIGWDETLGADAFIAVGRSTVAVTRDIHVEIDEVVACDDRVMAVRLRWVGTAAEGGGRLEVPLGAVISVRDGKAVTYDQYEHDDTEALLARYAALGGTRSALGDRPPERVFAALVRRIGAHDLDGLLAGHADDWLMIDHRVLGWEEVRGQEAARKLYGSAFAGSNVRFDCDEVVACDDRVIALRGAWRGTSPASGGAFEVAIGVVATVEGGRIATFEVYEPEDREAMLARYAELGATPSVLGEKPPERLWAELIRRVAARDIDALLELYDPAYVMTDHRKLAWDETRGLDAIRTFWESALASSPDVRVVVEEVIACDDRVLAARATMRGTNHDGGGEWEVQTGRVIVVEGGRFVSSDQYEPGDRAAIVARYAELGGGQGALGASPLERWVADYVRRYAKHDIDLLGEVLADDAVNVDERPAGAGVQRGREEIYESQRVVGAGAPDIRIEIDEVLACDERVIALVRHFYGTASTALGGGPFEVSLGAVWVVEDGLWVEGHEYDADDREAMLACYARLGGRRTSGEREPERVLAEMARRFAARDVDGVGALCSPDYVLVDHRGIGWDEVRGTQGAREVAESALNLSPDIRFEVDEVLACDDRVIATLTAFRGSSPDAADGEFESVMGRVTVVEAGLVARVEQFEPDDRAAMVARYAELGGGLGQLGDGPPELVSAEYARRFARRDGAALGEIVTDECLIVDHRLVGAGEIRGREAFVELHEAVWSGTVDVRSDLDEVLACGDRAIAFLNCFRGTVVAGLGGGCYEVAYGSVLLVRDGLLAEVHLFEPEDRVAILACFDELSSGGLRAPERFFAEYDRVTATHDVERLLALYAEDFVLVDHRTMGYHETRGHDALRRAIRAGFDAFPDLTTNAEEVIACDDRVIALRWVWRGHALEADGGGEVMFAVGCVAVVADGRWRSADYYEPDDREAMLARYAELARAVLGDSAPERALSEHLRRIEARDLDGARAMFAHDVAVGDHRALGAPVGSGRDAATALVASALDITSELHFELEEVLAGDDRALACRGAWVGTGAEGGGELSLAMALVVSVRGDEIASLDLYEHADVTGATARQVELGGDSASLGDSVAGRVVQESIARFNADDVDGHGVLHAPEFALTDHRSVGWGEIRGRDELADWVRSSLYAPGGARFEVDEVLADSDCIIAFTAAWRSEGAAATGSWEIPVGFVSVVRDGLVRSHDLYEPGDRDALLARFWEALRPYERFDRLFNERRLDELPALYSEDFVLVDRRTLAWEEIRGRRALVEVAKSTLDSLDAAQVSRIDVVLDDGGDVVVFRNTFSGPGQAGAGAWEIVMDDVMVLRDGLICRIEQFDPDDPSAALARAAELVGGGRGEVLGLLARYLSAHRARDWDAIAAIVSPEVVLDDRRPVGLGRIEGVDALLRAVRGIVELMPDVRVTVPRVLSLGEATAAYRYEMAGHDARGGFAQIAVRHAIAVADGRIASIEMAELDG